MNSPATSSRDALRIAIIGGGASGALAACALARQAHQAEVSVIDPRPGRGVAYRGRDPRHLLNTRARNMSLDPAAPADFLDWLNRTQAGGRSWSPDDFAPRMVFGDYLQDALEGAVAGPTAVELVRERAVEARPDGEGWLVRLRHGEVRRFDVVILANGNAPPRPLDFPGREAAEPFMVDNPWDNAAIEAIPARGDALLVGTGLTAVDAAVSLLSRPHGPGVVAASRRGLLPRIHDRAHTDLPQLKAPYPTTARGIYRQVRDLAEAVAGDDAFARHSVFLGLKPIIPVLWARLPTVEKRRFLRHLRAWWEVERHRLAPEIAAVLAKGAAAGRFRTARGRIVACRPLADGEGLAVTLASAGRSWTMIANRIVNCTGPDQDIGRSHDLLIRSLIDQGAGLDAVRLGFDVDDQGAVRRGRGPAWKGLYALGSLTRGSFFEITAVPEIREQAHALATHLAIRARVEA